MLVEKGVYEYLAAARIVKLKYPDSEFVILGGLDPDNPAALSKEQLSLAISEGLVIYPGHVSNVPEWLANSHVFVLPSYREGFPRSTQEAMAMGRAIITTDVPGCRETVQDGKNGFLIPLFDVGALAEKMIYLIEYPDKIARMGNESYSIALEKFDVNKINPVLEKLIVEG
jgi:glycosyltransferase involved in cell wall biosynthesis